MPSARVRNRDRSEAGPSAEHSKTYRTSCHIMFMTTLRSAFVSAHSYHRVTLKLLDRRQTTRPTPQPGMSSTHVE